MVCSFDRYADSIVRQPWKEINQFEAVSNLLDDSSAISKMAKRDALPTGLELNGCLPSIADQKALQPGVYKTINSLLYLAPVPAVIQQHSFVDGQASGQLKIKNGFRLFIRKKTVLHKYRDIVLLGKLTELVQQLSGCGIV